MTLTARARKRLGVRASAWAEDRGLATRSGRGLVPDHYEIPKGVCRTLSRVYGTPFTIDRGEVAYWEVPQDDLEQPV